MAFTDFLKQQQAYTKAIDTSSLGQMIQNSPQAISLPSSIQQIQPIARTDSTGGTTAGSGTYSDPYAQWGGKAAYDTLNAGFNTQKANIYGTANEAGANAGVGIRSSILDLVDSLNVGQRRIDNSAVNNELAKKQGVQGVLGSVSRGIKSGGVMLANKNAGDSSAAGELARAYGTIGRGQLSNVGNQYEMKNRDIALQQEDLGTQRATGVRKIGESKEQVVNNIVLEARDKLAQLDAARAAASLPDRLAIDQEKESIKGQVLAQLSQYDAMLRDQTNAIQASSQDTRRSEASRLFSLGQAPEDAFNYDTEVPAQFQGTGPFPSELPLFSTLRGRKVA